MKTRRRTQPSHPGRLRNVGGTQLRKSQPRSGMSGGVLAAPPPPHRYGCGSLSFFALLFFSADGYEPPASGSSPSSPLVVVKRRFVPDSVTFVHLLSPLWLLSRRRSWSREVLELVCGPPCGSYLFVSRWRSGWSSGWRSEDLLCCPAS